jgi:hypothetical protein
VIVSLPLCHCATVPLGPAGDPGWHNRMSAPRLEYWPKCGQIAAKARISSPASVGGWVMLPSHAFKKAPDQHVKRGHKR